MSQRGARAPPPQVKLPGTRGSAPGAGRQTDECLKYLDMLFREYLLYRGLTTTLATFNQELATEPTAGGKLERHPVLGPFEATRGIRLLLQALLFLS